MSHQPRNVAQRTLLLVCVGLTVAMAVPVALGAVSPGVRGQWVMRSISSPTWSGLYLALPALGLILLLAATAYSKIEFARPFEEAITVAMLVVFLAATQFAVGSLGKFGGQESFLAITTDTTNLYFTEAGTIDNLGQYLRQYGDRAARSEGWQLKTHPPGPVLFFYAMRSAVKSWPGLKRAILGLADGLTPEAGRWRTQPAFAFLSGRLDRDAEAAAWLAVAILRFAAALSAVPLYLFARKLYGKQKAVAAAALGGLIPSLLLFNTIIDQLYALIGLTAVLLGYHAAARRSVALNVLAGVVLFAGGMFSVSFLMFFAFIVPVQAWMLLVGKKKSDLAPALRRLMVHTEALLIGTLLGVVALYVVGGFSTIRSWAQCVRANALFNEASGRTYLAWLLANPIMFAAFLGAPAATLFAGRVVSQARMLIERRALSALDAPAVVTIALLAVLWLYGANLGEVERLWMPLMPLCVLAGIGALDFTLPRLVILLGLQGLQAIIFRMSLDPLGLERIIEQMTEATSLLC